MSTKTKVVYNVVALDGGEWPRERGFCYRAGYPNQDVAAREAQKFQADGQPCEVVRVTTVVTVTQESVATFDVPLQGQR